MAENLKTTHYNDGTPIPHVPDEDWFSIYEGAYCWYNNDEPTYGRTYGALYNWFVIETGNLCPEGWHVPNDNDWNVLIQFLGGNDLAGGKLKEAGFDHWKSPNTDASNITGFNALPSGIRYSGQFSLIGEVCGMWSSTSRDVHSASVWNFWYNSSELIDDWVSKYPGYSIRCVKD